MKKIYLIFYFLLTGWGAFCQEMPTEQRKQEDIEALKVAFISKELQLTKEEAERFWPIYNQYTSEIKATVKNEPDVLDRDEKVLNIRKKYRDQLTKIIGNQRVNRMFEAEGHFRQVLIKAIQNQRRNRVNREMLRRR